ncbi:Gfo/Idh/MocA family protein [Paenibacillus tarimensis]|uniref:Gfo/Idh/MocA family protein n=1 Tax=Paenibacillus tarimensis TaxID=416012 RepID=UPI001F28361E|nr:Gfo/Idh/MocA family oxidoreductase [Paenibacillus tarimensis]MCF2943726.1 Gfo/Idh/MocA family oxidoreductase [Paenibacillus tarimensis]
MSNKLRWGIMGAAGIAKGAVIPAIQQSESGVVTALASRDQDKAEAAAREMNIPAAYGSYEALLADPDIDAVYIPLPNHLHREWAIRAAEAGKHVLCEKPLALNAGQAQEMVDACARAGVHLAEAFMYRHHPVYDLVAGIIRSGEIGEIRAIHSAFTFNNADDKSNVRYRKDWGGGSLYDVGCYPLSAARLLLGAEPEAVTVQTFVSAEHDNVDMMASGLVEFAGGVALTFDCGMWASFRNVLEIVGSVGRIELPQAFVINTDNLVFYVHTADEMREVKAPQVNAYTMQADDFAAVVRGGQPPRYAAQDAVANMRLIDACLLSAEQRSRITL